MSISNTRPLPLPPLRNVLVVGGGGREQSLAWALKRCPDVQELWISPGNAGTADLDGCSPLTIPEHDHEGLVAACRSHLIDLVVIGPEAPLAAGLADRLREQGIAVFGPSAEGAQLEASKAWAKQFMQEEGIPTAGHWTITNEKEGLDLLQKLQRPLVVKADGLAAGKGVTVADNMRETTAAIHDAFQGRFGNAGDKVVLEERLVGPEVSVFALCDGEEMVLLPPAQDHKRLLDGDQGPNTGGMGAYAPAPLLDPAGLEQIREHILMPTLTGLRRRGISYQGVIYAGLMLTADGPKVIEFNCRFGDPECQTLMPLMGPELARILQACALGRLAEAPALSALNLCSACVVSAAAGYPDTPRKGDSIVIEGNLNQTKAHQLQLFHAGTLVRTDGVLETAGGRVLAMVAQATDFDQAFEKAYEGLSQVHYDGMQFRKDIGHQVRTPKLS